MDKAEFTKIMKNNPFTPLTDAIYEYLYAAIVQLRILPGTKLNVSRIAEVLGVSRTPVRSALEKLEEKRLLYKEQNKLFVVTHMTKEESNALYESRIALEGFAAYLAVTNITAEQLKLLKQLNDSYRQICMQEKIDPVEYAECDHRFHGVIIEASANSYIADMYGVIEGRLSHYRHHLIPEVGQEPIKPILLKAAKRHQAIVNAIELGFAQAAKNSIEEDIGGMKDALRIWLEKN